MLLTRQHMSLFKTNHIVFSSHTYYHTSVWIITSGMCVSVKQAYFIRQSTVCNIPKNHIHLYMYIWYCILNNGILEVWNYMRIQCNSCCTGNWATIMNTGAWLSLFLPSHCTAHNIVSAWIGLKCSIINRENTVCSCTYVYAIVPY